jgi:hypothetical protein
MTPRLRYRLCLSFYVITLVVSSGVIVWVLNNMKGNSR